jgi:hypothetical protein
VEQDYKIQSQSSLCTLQSSFDPRAIHTDQVSVLEVETIELIACLFGVVDVLVDDKSSSFGVVGDALANLAASKVVLDGALNRGDE